MDAGPSEGIGEVEVHSQDAMVADLLQQAAEAGGVVEGQTGVVLEQGSYKLGMILFYSLAVKRAKSRSYHTFLLHVIFVVKYFVTEQCCVSGHGEEMVAATQQQLMEAGVGVEDGPGVEMMVMDSLDPTLLQMKTEVRSLLRTFVFDVT